MPGSNIVIAIKSVKRTFENQSRFQILTPSSLLCSGSGDAAFKVFITILNGGKQILELDWVKPRAFITNLCEERMVRSFAWFGDAAMSSVFSPGSPKAQACTHILGYFSPEAL